MKRLIIIVPLLFVLIFASYVLYFFLTFNAFDACPDIPQQKKFSRNIQKIEKYKFWEMENLSAAKNSGHMFFMVDPIPNTAEEQHRIINLFVEKNLDAITSDFILSRENYEHLSYDINFYKVSKALPKYWTSTYGDKWTPRDFIEDHDEDLLLTVELNKDFSIIRENRLRCSK